MRVRKVAIIAGWICLIVFSLAGIDQGSQTFNLLRRVAAINGTVGFPPDIRSFFQDWSSTLFLFLFGLLAWCVCLLLASIDRRMERIGEKR